MGNFLIGTVALVGVLLMALVLICGGSFIMAWPFMMLWNWIAVGLFAAPALSFWQAFGGLLLLSFLKPQATASVKTDK